MCYFIQQEEGKGAFFMEVLIDHGNEVNSKELIDRVIDFLAEEQQ
jgi:hypothetical protein